MKNNRTGLTGCHAGGYGRMKMGIGPKPGLPRNMAYSANGPRQLQVKDNVMEKEATRLWDCFKDRVLEFRKNQKSVEFLAPVDWVKLKLPLYPGIVKNRMDLNMIASS